MSFSVSQIDSVPIQCDRENHEHQELYLEYSVCPDQSEARSNHKTANHKSNYHYGLWFILLVSDGFSFPTQQILQKIILVFVVIFVALQRSVCVSFKQI